MKKLYLIRHAKAEEPNLKTNDFDRNISSRGKQDADIIRQILKDKQLTIDQIHCSSAKRTVSTAQYFEQFSQNKLKTHQYLYLASKDDIYDFIQEQDDNISSAAIVGHNPGIGELIQMLNPQIKSIPTLSILIVQWQCDLWAEIENAQIINMEYLNPKTSTFTR